jgi:hypothetical protein
VTAWADGSGKVGAARRPVVGRSRVARYLVGTFGRRGQGAVVSLAELNGEPAVLGWVGVRLLGVLVLDIADGQVRAVRTVANPEKLRFVRARPPTCHSPGGCPVPYR